MNNDWESLLGNRELIREFGEPLVHHGGKINLFSHCMLQSRYL